jgi:Lon protease-like protein
MATFLTERSSKVIVIVLLALRHCESFVSTHIRPQRGFSNQLFGISEWRDLEFQLPAPSRPLGGEQGPLPKSICLLPFPYEEVLLQGETKQLRLYEDRFIKLFDDCIQNHAGVVAMGLLAESGIIQAVPLCEIESYNRMKEFGIFVTIRAVGRAKLTEITQQAPYIKAVCTEISDKLPPKMELANLLGNKVESIMTSLSEMEHQLEKADEGKGGTILDEDDAEMRRRINIAKLEDRFYADDNNADEDDDDDDDEENETERTRQDRFRIAFKVAKESDTQGYQLISRAADEKSPQDLTDISWAAICAEGEDKSKLTVERSPQDLTAISWAAFCTEIFAEQDAMYRIQALDFDNLFDRLKLAYYMLREKKNKTMAQIQKAGLKRKDSDDEADAR